MVDGIYRHSQAADKCNVMWLFVAVATAAPMNSQLFYYYIILPPSRNANTFGCNKAFSSPVKLVSGLTFKFGILQF